MIYDPRTSDPQQSAVVTQITAEVAGLPDGSLADPAQVAEIARAVDHFLKEDCGAYAVESQALLVMTAQAMAALGDGRMARRVVVFGSGLVRPSEWEVTGGDAVWVVDLKQITLHEGARLELALFTSLNVVLDAIADVWDPTQGRGTLGLRNVCRAAAHLLGTSKDKPVRELVAEVFQACTVKLEQLGQARGWEDVPAVMSVDGV